MIPHAQQSHKKSYSLESSVDDVAGLPELESDLKDEGNNLGKAAEDEPDKAPT